LQADTVPTSGILPSSFKAEDTEGMFLRNGSIYKFTRRYSPEDQHRQIWYRYRTQQFRMSNILQSVLATQGDKHKVAKNSRTSHFHPAVDDKRVPIFKVRPTYFYFL
jgi:hypothetical protein